MDRRARDAARTRHWGWLPTMIQEWITGERVPPYRFPGDTTPGRRLPPLGVPLEQAFVAHVACTRREIWRSGELSDEVRVLREKNDRLERRNDRLEERNSRLEEQVETLRLQVSLLMSQHGQMVDIMQEHDGRITENRVANEETQLAGFLPTKKDLSPITGPSLFKNGISFKCTDRHMRFKHELSRRRWKVLRDDARPLAEGEDEEKSSGDDLGNPTESFYMTKSCDPGHVTPARFDTSRGNLGDVIDWYQSLGYRELGMDNKDTGRNPWKRHAEYELTEEDR
ncbi:hypothetical protein E3N88_30702 [Mikania micrantha]|uniref:Uncharacterized protein n=1 Tax=Mikania micrantha TaxID=192012 RepID=A0A5N6MMZ4_9ASTR|nr:hypothetical protein E3N88_30702 [Mikania micrantha]